MRRIRPSLVDENPATSQVETPAWSSHVMQVCFSAVRRDVVAQLGQPAGRFEASLLPLDDLTIVFAGAVDSQPPPTPQMRLKASGNGARTTAFARFPLQLAPPVDAVALKVDGTGIRATGPTQGENGRVAGGGV